MTHFKPSIEDISFGYLQFFNFRFRSDALLDLISKLIYFLIYKKFASPAYNMPNLEHEPLN